MPDADASAIRALNDHARQTFTGCRVLITRGITALEEADVVAILAAVRRYNQFTPDNDPYGEHDFGSLQHEQHQVFWKIEYYDLDFTMRSLDPSDETVTARVLTIMLAEEY